jgi:hypothetical protein
MTQRKHFKQLVRARMEKTGESYATSRRIVLHNAPIENSKTDLHFPGNIPATTALRNVLTRTGVVDPHTKRPFTESMLFGIAGGIGAGMFTFLYEKADFASFFVAGRHSWMDDEAYLVSACKRLGVETVVKESSGVKPGEKHLRELLAEYGACIVWVDAAGLPHRAMPAHFSGCGYHVVTIYSIDDQTGKATVGDLTDEPISIPLADLAAARMRIKKFKNRLLAVKPGRASADVRELVQSGLQACVHGLTKQKIKNFTLESFKQWADRLHASKDKESWERIFTLGKRLWQGLTSIYDYIEHYGTGGGLCRPIFADFLNEAGAALNNAKLKALALRYDELGRNWTELAKAALYPGVPLFKKAQQLLAEKAELVAAGASAEEVRNTWIKLDALAKEASECFPLNAKQADTLRADLQKRVQSLYVGESSALAAIQAVL